MVVRTNTHAINAHRNLTNVGLLQRQSAARISSGFRINSAADDAAGLAISEVMRAQIRGLDQASVNAQDAVGLVQTAEGAMSTISEKIIRIRELMVQAANDTNTRQNRDMIQLEIDQLMQEINEVTFRTQFNTRTLLDGGITGGGGQANPVSLQWMLFQQVREIGLQNHHGLRQNLAEIQADVDALASSDNLQFRRIKTRLESTLRGALQSAQEVYRITQAQIAALGGEGATNSDGSNVFLRHELDRWNDAAYGARATLDTIRYAIIGSGTMSEGLLGELGAIVGVADLQDFVANLTGNFPPAGLSGISGFSGIDEISPFQMPGYFPITAATIGYGTGGGGRWTFTGGVLTIHNVSHPDAIRIDGISLAGVVDRIVIAPGADLTSPNRGLILDSVALISSGIALDMRSASVDLWLPPGSNNLLLGTGIQGTGIATTDGNLRIMGSGSLDAIGNNGAGIGGVPGGDSGNITIYGGNIIAQTTGGGAAIGGGLNAPGGNLTINGGVVEILRGNHGGDGTATGTTTINGGHFLGGEPILATVENEHGTPIFRTRLDGLPPFSPHELVEVTIGGTTHTLMADSLGVLRFFHPPSPTGTLPEIQITRGDTTYAGALFVSSHHENVVSMTAVPDPPPPPPTGFLDNIESLLRMALNVLGNVTIESNALWFQTGANAMQGMVVQMGGVHTGVLGGRHGDLALLIDVREESGIPISEQLNFIATAENIVNAQRAKLGAVQNRLEFTRQSVDIAAENLTSAESRVRDADIAREMMRFTKAQTLQQAGISMLAQANQLPSVVLQLLQ